LISNVEENVRFGLKDSLNVSRMYLDRVNMDGTVNPTNHWTCSLSLLNQNSYEVSE